MIKVIKFHFILFSIFVMPISVIANTNWEATTKTELKKIQSALIKHSIVASTKELPEQIEWLDKGYRLAIKDSANVRKLSDYRKVLITYIKGFKQPHLYISTSRQLISLKVNSAVNSYSNDSTYIKKLDDNTIWIKIANFEPETKQQVSQLENIINSISLYRDMKLIVFDLRSNPGGNSEYYRKLLKNLYGEPFLRGLGKRFLWNQQWDQRWKLSSENIKLVESQWPHLANQMKQALIKHKNIYQEKWYVLDPKGGVSHKNLVTAKIAVVTDKKSYSAAWMFTRILKQLPDVTHLGKSTGIKSYYGNPRAVSLKYGLQLNFPMAANIKPTDGFGKRLKPDIVYQDDIHDDRSLVPWVLNQLQPQNR